jgi:hypothetical protein
MLYMLTVHCRYEKRYASRTKGFRSRKETKGRFDAALAEVHAKWPDLQLDVADTEYLRDGTDFVYRIYVVGKAYDVEADSEEEAVRITAERYPDLHVEEEASGIRWSEPYDPPPREPAG